MLIVPAMDLATFFSLAVAAFVFGISPGPGTLAALSVSTTQGLRSGLVLSAGEGIGDVIYLSMAILSLGISLTIFRTRYEFSEMGWCRDT
jgi:threonine/homoserine/homoserine lactone efflux protein